MANMALYGVTKTAQERMTQFLDFEAGGRGVSFNVFCVNTVVTTEGWRTVMEQQGEEIAMGGATELVSPEECGDISAWMLRQPSSWSGLSLTIHELRELMHADATA
jgi:NAD(P)-dependent dehydrogenase (short-subunit alcohol dehydrogenase family)